MKMTQKFFFFSILVGVLFFFLSQSQGEKKRIVNFPLEQKLYQLELNPENNKVIPYSQINSKLKLFYFWASWCEICEAQTPKLEDLWHELIKTEQKLKTKENKNRLNSLKKVEKIKKEKAETQLEKKISFFGVATSDQRTDIRTSGKLKSMSFNKYFDENDQLQNIFQIKSIPQTFLINQKGVVIYHIDGVIQNKDIQEIKKRVL